MPNNYGIIICDQSQSAKAGTIGRKLLNSTTQSWQAHEFRLNGAPTVRSVKAAKPCDGNFTGHFLILMHGNYNEKNTKGLLYLQVKEKYHEITDQVIQFVNGQELPQGIQKRIYIFACGQGRQEILDWYRSDRAFDTANVWSPCRTAAMGGSLDEKDIRKCLGLPNE